MLKKTQNQELSEEGEAAAAPEAGTSSDGEKKTGAKKWESGIKRGPANPIGVGKWSDTEGTQPVRGHANPLSEQIPGVSGNVIDPNTASKIVHNLDPANDTEVVEVQTIFDTKIKVPKDFKLFYFKDNDKRLLVKSKKVIGDKVYWTNGGYHNKRPMYELAPPQEELDIIFPTGGLRGFETNDGKYFTFLVTRQSVQKWAYRYKGYYYFPNENSQGVAWNEKQEDLYIHVSFTTEFKEFLSEHWEVILQIVISVAVGIITAGQSLWIQALAEFSVNAAFAAKQLVVDKDAFGASISLILGMVPFTSVALRKGFGQAIKGLDEFGPALSKATTEAEAQTIIAGFSEGDQIIIKKIFQLPKAELEMAMKEATISKYLIGIKSGAIDIVKIPLVQRTWFVQSLYELAGMTVTAITAGKIAEKYAKELVSTEKYYDPKKKGFNTPEVQREIKKVEAKLDSANAPISQNMNKNADIDNNNK